MGDFFLYGLLACFLVYELVMHFALKNEGGNETLSHIVRRLEGKRWWVRIITTLALVVLFLHLVLMLFVVSARAQTIVLPPVKGQAYHGVTQANLSSTVCMSGFTATIRPPTAYTSALKKWLLKDRGLPGTVSDYQLDHLISLELGGAPYSTQNLWMQPNTVAHRDDSMENSWHAMLCSGGYTLKQARATELSWKRTNG